MLPTLLFFKTLFSYEKVRTQVFHKPEHDPADVKIALDSDQPFRLQLGDVDPQIPRAVTDYLSIRQHLDCFSV